MGIDKKYIVVIIITLLLLFGLIINTWRSNQLIKYEKNTTGKIIDFKSLYQSHQLTYRYVINGVAYQKSVSVNYFECDDGTPGCKGREFKIKYSSKNPNNSEINLGKFNDKKLIKPSL